MLWATILFMMFVASMMGLLMFVQKYPEISGKLGMIGDKAQMLRFGDPNWQNYFRLAIEGMAGVGLVASGFITSWIFGREFSDHTLKDILALPVSRESIVLSKIIMVFLWFTILSFSYFVLALIAGMLIGLPGLSHEIIRKTYTSIVTSILILFLSTPVAFFASYCQGIHFPDSICDPDHDSGQFFRVGRTWSLFPLGYSRTVRQSDRIGGNAVEKSKLHYTYFNQPCRIDRYTSPLEVWRSEIKGYRQIINFMKKSIVAFFILIIGINVLRKT